MMFPYYFIKYIIGQSIYEIKGKPELNSSKEFYGNIWLVYSWYERPFSVNMRMYIRNIKSSFERAMKTNKQIREENEKIRTIIREWKKKNSIY